MEFTTRPHGRSNLDQHVQGRLTTATSWGVQKLETTSCPSWQSDNLKDGLTGKSHSPKKYDALQNALQMPPPPVADECEQTSRAVTHKNQR